MTQRVLITGASGAIGRLLLPRLARPQRVLRVLDVEPVPAADPAVEVHVGSITDPPTALAACREADAVVHLAGLSTEAPWSQILATNVDGTRTVLDAAVQCGVPRVVLASSNHAAGFWSREHATQPGGLPASVPPRPDTFYGWSKAAIEALGSLYHDRFGLDVSCLRIGSCDERPADPRALATWLSPADCARLVEACLAVEPAGFRILWGISDNRRRWWSLAEGQAIGYQPQDDAEDHAATMLAAHGEPDLEDPEHALVGGPFCRRPLGEAAQE